MPPQPQSPAMPPEVEAAVAQIRSCKFECEGGPLENNVGWIALLAALASVSAPPGWVCVPRELRPEDKLFLIAHFEKYAATIPEPKAVAWDFLHGWRALIEHIAAGSKP